jgi:hypothetical protein
VSAADDLHARLLAATTPAAAASPQTGRWSWASPSPRPPRDSWDVAASLSAQFWPRVGPPLTDLQRKIGDVFSQKFQGDGGDIKTALRFLPTPSINARVWRASDREYLICIDEGLLRAVYTLTGLALVRYVPTGPQWEQGAATGAYCADGRVTDEVIDRAVRAYLGTYIITSGVGLPLQIRLPKGIEEIRQHITGLTLAYFAGHEAAHVMLNHIAGVPGDDQLVKSWSMEEEVRADAWSARLLMNLEDPLAPYAVLVACYIGEILQGSAAPIEAGSHPSSRERFGTIREFIEGRVITKLENLDVFMSQLSNWAEESSNPSRWVPKAEHHLLNSLPVAGPVDFLLLRESGKLGKPEGEDDTKISRLISMAEDDFRKRTLSPMFHAAEIGVALYVDSRYEMPQENVDTLFSWAARATKQDRSSPVTKEAARSLLYGLLGQHWFLKGFLPSFLRDYSRTDDLMGVARRVALRGVGYADLALLPPDVLPITVRKPVSRLLDAARRGRELDIPIPPGLMPAIEEITALQG